MKHMKQIFLLVISVICFPLMGQRIALGYVDTDYILGRMTEYKSAQTQLEDLSAKWEADAQKLQNQLTQMEKDYQAEEILLTSDQKKVKKDAISVQEKELIKFREDKFGSNGALFKKREELIKPIQDKLFEAVQSVAKKEGFDFVFDKASGVQMLYANPKFDKTFEVLEELGIPLTENESNPKGKGTTPSPNKPR